VIRGILWKMYKTGQKSGHKNACFSPLTEKAAGGCKFLHWGQPCG